MESHARVAEHDASGTGFIRHAWFYDGRSVAGDQEVFLEKMAKTHHYKLQVPSSPTKAWIYRTRVDRPFSYCHAGFVIHIRQLWSRKDSTEPVLARLVTAQIRPGGNPGAKR